MTIYYSLISARYLFVAELGFLMLVFIHNHCAGFCRPALPLINNRYNKMIKFLCQIVASG